jgi:hypothetical protein
MLSGRYPYSPPHMMSPRGGCATGTPAGISGLGGSFWFALSSRHALIPFENMPFTAYPFGHCLVTRADRPPPNDGAEAAPF